MEKLINCTHLSVDCVEIDSVDRRCEGPDFLGFDFFVETAKVDEMETFTRLLIKELEVPLMGLQRLETLDLPEEKVWTKEKITEYITNDANYLISAEEHAQSLRYIY